MSQAMYTAPATLRLASPTVIRDAVSFRRSVKCVLVARAGGAFRVAGRSSRVGEGDKAADLLIG
jgi:hypothetical protein